MLTPQQEGEFSQDFQELKEALDFGCDLQDGFTRSLSDGDLDLADAVNFWPAVRTAGPAIKNLGNPVQRYRALVEVERKALHAHARQRFDLPEGHDQIEFLIEDTLEYVDITVRGGVKLGQRWSAIVKAAA